MSPIPSLLAKDPCHAWDSSDASVENMPKESRTLLVSVHGLTWTYSLYIPKIRVFDLGHGRNSVGVPR